MTDVTTHHGFFKDTKLHVDDTGGSGRPVVLIHGWPLTSASWKYQVPALKEAGYRVITYDRRGFGASDKPLTGYTYDDLATDLHNVLEAVDVTDVTVVGFSMGGGEVARYFSLFADDRLRSVVFAAAVPPYMMQSEDNPNGPLTKEQAAGMAKDLTVNEDEFYDGFVTQFLTANGELKVTEAQRQETLTLCSQASKPAALQCMTAFGMTDFRDDLKKVNVPALIIHGDSDGVVPFEGSGKRTHDALAGSELHMIAGAPHGCNASDADEFNSALIEFLAK